MKTFLFLLTGFLLASHCGAQGLFWGTGSPTTGPTGPTFDQLAASNSIAVYDLTKMGYTVGQANINLTDSSGNSRNLTLGNTGPYATNNVSELNGTNFWTYDNGTATSARWSGVSVTVAQPVTVYCLMRIRSTASWNFFDLSGESFRWHNSNGQWDLNAGSALSGGTLTTGTWLWFKIQFNASSSIALQYPSTTLVIGNVGANGMTAIEIGDDASHTFFYNGDIAFMSFHSSAMSSGFDSQFYAAAKTRFGSQVQ